MPEFSSPLYRLVDERYEAVKGQWEERFESSYGRWRGLVDGKEADTMKPRWLIYLVPCCAVLWAGCHPPEPGIEVMAANQLQIREGFTAYIAITSDHGELLIVEPDSPGTLVKAAREPAWRCTCGKEGDDGECKIKTSEGSDTAECRGDCFCGFTKEPAPDEKLLISKTRLALGR